MWMHSPDDIIGHLRWFYLGGGGGSKGHTRHSTHSSPVGGLFVRLRAAWRGPYLLCKPAEQRARILYEALRPY